MSNVGGEKIQLSRDEYRNITRCLENQEFRKLFAEYCEELNDPVNKKQYEEELKVLEAERGYDIKFIKPLPGYVIKTVADGKTKAFVNVCHCDLIGKPASQGSTNENGQKGLKWSIPYAQCQPRKDYDNKKIECIVYDVVFHYDTLHLAKSNAGFRKLVTDTAIDAVESAFKVSLDRVNLKFPKLQYKGVPKMTVIRQKLDNYKSQQQNDNIIDKLYPVREQNKPVDNKSANKENIDQKVSKSNPQTDYAIPSYKLIHRKDVEYHELTEELDAKLNAATPKELVLVIELPLLKSANDCTLNVTSKEVHLISEKPAKYKLQVKLPYDVLEKDGSAKFNTDEKTLTIVLPVLKARSRLVLNDINGTNNVESNESKNTETPMEPDEVKSKTVAPTKCAKGPQVVSRNATRKVIFPKFSTNKMDNIFAFTINVRNVDPNSIELQKGVDTVSCRFTNIGNGFFPCYYVFFARFPNTTISDVLHEEWDNNFILQVVLEDSQVSCYYAGADENDLVEYSIMDDISDKINNLGKEIEDDSLCIAVSKNAAKRERKSQLSIEIKTKSDTESEGEEPENAKTDQPARRQNIIMEQGGNDETVSPGTEVEMKTFDDVEESEKRDSVHEGKKSKRHSRRKNKKRSLSESCCDQLQVLVENERPKVEQNSNVPPTTNSAESDPNAPASVPNQRKARSVSESFTSTTSAENAGSDSASVDNLTALIQFNRKYKGILKRSSFERSISECSSVDDHYYLGTSVDASSVAGSVDHPNGELSESCRKHVRFNDLIKTKLFRSNTSILGQKKKNAKKNESKRRALTRRLSEGESTDNDDKDHVNGNEGPIPVAQPVDHEHDSGVSLDSDVGCLSTEKELESDVAVDQYQSDSKPIDINHNVGSKKFVNSKKEDDSKKAKSPKRKNAKKADSSNIEFKSDMIFDIEM